VGCGGGGWGGGGEIESLKGTLFMESLRDKRDVIYPCVKSEANKLVSALELLFRRSLQCLILCNMNNVTVTTGVGKRRCYKLPVCAIISVFHLSFPIFLSEMFLLSLFKSCKASVTKSHVLWTVTPFRTCMMCSAFRTDR
jgi:hypothetical protein